MSIEKPTDLQKNIVVKEKILMTAGVTKIDPRISSAMSLPLLPPFDPQFHQILKDIVEGIRYLFQTTNRYSFAINGPLSLAFETALSNLLEESEKVMVIIHGVQGERLAITTRALGFKLLRLQIPNPGELVDKTTIKNALETHKPKVLFLCHGDDSVGTLQPLRGIGDICHQNDCLFIVDSSCTVGCLPLNCDQMEIDVLIAGTEYALGVSPGLTLISFNNRATDLIKTIKKDRICFTMNFELLVQSWGLLEDSSLNYTGFYTPPISLLYALRESLAVVAEEGLDKSIARHMKCSIQAQNEFTKIGLRYLVSDEHNRLTSVLVILVPESIRRDAIIDYMLKYYNIAISSGLSPIDKVWRIGILGPNANRNTIKLMTGVLREAIEKAKKSSDSKKSVLSSPSTTQ